MSFLRQESAPVDGGPKLVTTSLVGQVAPTDKGAQPLLANVQPTPGLLVNPAKPQMPIRSAAVGNQSFISPVVSLKNPAQMSNVLGSQAGSYNPSLQTGVPGATQSTLKPMDLSTNTQGSFKPELGQGFNVGLVRNTKSAQPLKYGYLGSPTLAGTGVPNSLVSQPAQANFVNPMSGHVLSNNSAVPVMPVQAMQSRPT